MDDSPTTAPQSDSARVPETVPELIEAFGGATVFARVIGKGPSTASEQKRSGRIEVEYWGAIIAAAPEFGVAGITYESLAKMQAPRRVVPLAAEARP